MSINLRSYFIFIFTIFIIVFTCVITYVVNEESSKNVEYQISQSLTEKAYQLSERLDYFMWSRYGEITLLSQLNTFKKGNDIEDINVLIDELKTNIPSYSWIGFTNERGIVKASNDDILLGGDISKRPVFTEATSQTFIGDVHDAVLLAKLLPNPTGEPLQFVDVSSPIFSQDGKFKGVLAAHLSWEWAKEVKQSVIRPLQQNEDQLEVFIISRKDNTVLLGPKKMIGKALHLESINMAQTRKNNWLLEKWPDGKTYLTGYAYSDGLLNYPGLEWTVLVRQPEDVAFASVKNIRNEVIVLGVLFSVLFAVIGWFLSGVIASPLRQLALTAKRLTNGERVEVPIKRGIRDIEILSTSLRDLILTLTKTETDLDRMESLAQLDKLTGLPNRLALDEYIKKIKESMLKETNQYAFMYIDLDGFKKVNDQFGHHHGDILLKAVANRIKCCIRSNEYVFRLGGDEFVIILEPAETINLENTNIVGNRIIESLNEAFTIEGNIVKIGCSIGSSVWTSHDIDPYQVLRNADNALYKSKENGKNQLSFYNKPA